MFALAIGCTEATPRATAPGTTTPAETIGEATTRPSSSEPLADSLAAPSEASPTALDESSVGTGPQEPTARTQVEQDRGDGRKARRPFLNGDIIFHEANSEQSELVRIVTRSNWTHLGVIWNGAEGMVVYEAAAPVKATPLDAWVKRGKGGSFVVKRLALQDDVKAELDETATTKMKDLVQQWLGLPYDYRFRWDDEQMYCSEFVYKLFERGTGRPVGKLEKAKDMALDDPIVQMIIKSHWGKAAYNPNEPVVTPDSIFRDPRLIEVEL